MRRSLLRMTKSPLYPFRHVDTFDTGQSEASEKTAGRYRTQSVDSKNIANHKQPRYQLESTPVCMGD